MSRWRKDAVTIADTSERCKSSTMPHSRHARTFGSSRPECLKEAGFSLAELDYLLRHQAGASVGIVQEGPSSSIGCSELRLELQKSAGTETIARKLGEIFSLTIETIEDCGNMESLIDPALADDTKDLATDYPGAARVSDASAQVVCRRGEIQIGAKMLQWLLGPGRIQGLFDLGPTADGAHCRRRRDVDAARRLAGAPRATSRGETGLLHLLALFRLGLHPRRRSVIQTLAEMTGWNRTDLDVLVGPNALALSLPDGLRKERALLRLESAVALLTRLGMSAAQARSLSTDVDLLDRSAGCETCGSREVRRRAMAELWPSRCANMLRERQRQGARRSTCWRTIRNDAGGDAADLSGHFLIDVEMSAVHDDVAHQAGDQLGAVVRPALPDEPRTRCAASAEVDETGSVDVDEELSGVGGQPQGLPVSENWIEPELRDDKSPFFRELESELMEGDLTRDTAEAAFLQLSGQGRQVARLDIMGVHHDKDGVATCCTSSPARRRRRTCYYYRRRVDSAYWTPWEKVDVGIEGDHLIPVLWSHRLFLFWPMFMEKAETAAASTCLLRSRGGRSARP